VLKLGRSVGHGFAPKLSGKMTNTNLFSPHFQIGRPAR